MQNSSFTDAVGRTWQLCITIAHLKTLKEAGFDVKALGKEATAFDVLADPEAFAHVMYLLCEKQADKLGVEPEQFATGFDGPTIHAASSALLAAIVEFVHPPAVAKSINERLPGLLADVDTKSIELMNAAPGA